MKKYHHLGIPTSLPQWDETYLPEYGVHCAGYETSPYGIEWMRFEPGSPLPELIKTVPHIAFEVDDIEAALEGQDVLIPPNSPSPGIRVAFIVDNGVPVEFLQFEEPTEAE